MLTRIIEFSVRNKLIIALLVMGLIAWGIYSVKSITIDAVPDITNNQVQVVTISPNLAAQEVEQFITYPIEMTMANVPNVVELRSVSRYGLSVVTVVFEEKVPILDARQLVGQQLALAKAEIPVSYGDPSLMPITTGLGEIYQYTLEVKRGYEEMYNTMDLRTIHDWLVKRQLNGIPGVVEISSFGGLVKQYEVAIDPNLLRTFNLSLLDVNQALLSNNQNTGGGYISKGPYVYYIRADGLIRTMEDIEKVVVGTRNGVPVLIRDIGEVGISSPPRFGAMTSDGKGEAVGGITLMLKGGNASTIIEEIKRRVEQVNANLPEGLVIQPYLDRSVLVKKVIHTVAKNLIEGGLIVILVLLLMLGDWRAGLIVASVIPLAMLFAFSMMKTFGVSATVMSLGAIDFGLIVDATVIIVEGLIHQVEKQKHKLSGAEMDSLVLGTTLKIKSSAMFGALIILIVYFPLLTLVGVEGKMFKPMATTVSFAIIGALILSFTYVPMISSVFLKQNEKKRKSLSDRIMGLLHKTYRPVFRFALRNKAFVIISAFLMLGVSVVVYNRLGAEFMPDLDEGDLAMQMTNPAGCSLEESVRSSTMAEKILIESFPEVLHVISKIGTAEVPTDPMAIEDADIMITLKPRDEWVSAHTRSELINQMKESLSVIPGVAFEFTQPIQLRFNELLTGAKSDVVVKIYGEELDVLYDKALEAAKHIEPIEGAEDVRVERIEGLPQIVVNYDRQKIATYGLNIEDLNSMVRTAMAGEHAGYIFEGERKFDLVVRMKEEYRNYLTDFDELYVRTPSGQQVPLKEVAKISYVENPVQISRDNTHRRITIGMNVRGRDVQSVVDDVKSVLSVEVPLAPGYYYTYGGKFENLQSAFKRLKVIVPVALLLIFVLLYFAFTSLRQAVLVFTTIPLSIIGGVFALWIRGLPFSISAGVGFIALFGVAVLDGIVLINHLNELKERGVTNLHRRLIKATGNRLRPVAITSAVAALGFLPMAISTTAGAEVQRPLATVVIGGIITSTFLTMVMLPLVYYYFEKGIKFRWLKKVPALMALLLIIPLSAKAQESPRQIDLDEAEKIMFENNPSLKSLNLGVEQYMVLGKMVPDLGMTELGYQHGQINSAATDYNITLRQNFGALSRGLTESRLYRREAEMMEVMTRLAEQDMVTSLRIKWNEWQYLNDLRELNGKMAGLYENLVRIAVARFESGEGSSLEMATLSNSAGSMILGLKETEYRMAALVTEIKALLFTDENIEPRDEEFVLAIPSSADEGTLHGALFDKTLERSQAGVALAKSELAPDLFIGYFNQQIDGTGGFQGWEAGVALPLWFMPATKKITASRIELRRKELEVAEQKRMVSDMILNLESSNALVLEKIDYYRERMIPGAAMIEENIEAMFSSGEAGYIELVNTLGAALRTRQDYLELQMQHNRILYQLELLRK